jgi:hypothetical protein
MSYKAINFGKKFTLFDEQWQPKVVAEMNDYQFKIVKLQGDFVWHDHKNTDEMFIVCQEQIGSLRSPTMVPVSLMACSLSRRPGLVPAWLRRWQNSLMLMWLH